MGNVWQKNIYSNVANVTFYLEESSSSDQSYIEISNVLESYKGKLKWVLKKSIGSRYNYSIIPEIIYKVDKDNFDELNKKFVRAKDLLDEKTYRKICDLAIQDIPHLYEYLLMQLWSVSKINFTNNLHVPLSGIFSPKC